MKKYFILTNYSEYYSNKMVLLKAANDVSANAYINRSIDKIIRESVLDDLEITSVERDDNENNVIISSYDSRGVQHQREYNFYVLEVDSITDFDKWFIFSNALGNDSNYVDVEGAYDFETACKKFTEDIDFWADEMDCKSVINWTTRTAKVGDDVEGGDYAQFVLMSVQEMLEIK